MLQTLAAAGQQNLATVGGTNPLHQAQQALQAQVQVQAQFQHQAAQQQQQPTQAQAPTTNNPYFENLQKILLNNLYEQNVTNLGKDSLNQLKNNFDLLSNSLMMGDKNLKNSKKKNYAAEGDYNLKQNEILSSPTGVGFFVGTFFPSWVIIDKIGSFF